MLRFLIRLLLAILTLRVLFGLVRLFGRIASRDPDARVDPGGGGGPRTPRGHAPQPIVDRASAIDVPFTEEPRES